MKKPSEYRTEREMQKIMPVLRENKFFKSKNITGSDLLQVCLELQYEFLRRGEFVFKAGDYGEKFYVILEGEVAVKIMDPANKGQPAKP